MTDVRLHRGNIKINSNENWQMFPDIEASVILVDAMVLSGRAQIPIRW